MPWVPARLTAATSLARGWGSITGPIVAFGCILFITSRRLWALGGALPLGPSRFSWQWLRQTALGKLVFTRTPWVWILTRAILALISGIPGVPGLSCRFSQIPSVSMFPRMCSGAYRAELVVGEVGWEGYLRPAR